MFYHLPRCRTPNLYSRFFNFFPLLKQILTLISIIFNSRFMLNLCNFKIFTRLLNVALFYYLLLHKSYIDCVIFSRMLHSLVFSFTTFAIPLDFILFIIIITPFLVTTPSGICSTDIENCSTIIPTVSC